MGTATNQLVIGLVGGVCSGKSTAAAELVSLGCELIDADSLGHRVLTEPAVREAVRRRWGGEVFAANGQVNREALGRIVFADETELAALNAISWPRIRSLIEQRIGELREAGNERIIVLDAAVLFEAGWDELCTHVLFVAAPEASRASRALRKGWDDVTWQRREKTQFPLDIKASRCYAAIDNSSTVSHLREQTRQAFYRIVQHADGSKL